jgi:RNA polymerase sigma-70 factor (ECF subfamily)
LALSQAEFNRLVAEHGAALYRLAFRLIGDRVEAEDVVQDAFRSAWSARENYEPDRGDRAWLATILRRRAADSYRKRHLKLVLAGDSTPEVESHDADPLGGDYSDEMQRALDQLPAELRETLLLVVVADLTHQEAADVLQVPLGTVLSRVSRARGRLREYLAGSPAKLSK